MSLQVNSSSLFDHPDSLLRTRLALLIGYYGDLLYDEKNDLMLNPSIFLLKGIGMEKTEKAFSLQCVDTMKCMLEDIKLNSQFKAILKDLIPCIIELIQITKQIVPILTIIIEKYNENLVELQKIIEKTTDQDLQGQYVQTPLLYCLTRSDWILRISFSPEH